MRSDQIEKKFSNSEHYILFLLNAGKYFAFFLHYFAPSQSSTDTDVSSESWHDMMISKYALLNL